MTYFGGMRLEDDHELCEREIATLKRANAALLAVVEAAKAARSLVDEQAEDEGLWSVPLVEGTQSIVEAYLQQELRRLHAIIEAFPLDALEAAP